MRGWSLRVARQEGAVARAAVRLRLVSKETVWAMAEKEEIMRQRQKRNELYEEVGRHALKVNDVIGDLFGIEQSNWAERACAGNMLLAVQEGNRDKMVADVVTVPTAMEKHATPSPQTPQRTRARSGLLAFLRSSRPPTARSAPRSTFAGSASAPGSSGCASAW